MVALTSEQRIPRTIHLVTELFYPGQLTTEKAQISYVETAEKGDALLKTDIDDVSVFNYFASLVLLAPGSNGNTYKESIETVWEKKQKELFAYVPHDELQDQSSWWNEKIVELAGALEKTFGAMAPVLTDYVIAGAADGDDTVITTMIVELRKNGEKIADASTVWLEVIGLGVENEIINEVFATIGEKLADAKHDDKQQEILLLQEILTTAIQSITSEVVNILSSESTNEVAEAITKMMEKFA